MEDKGFTYHIISHTHWDREWYLTFEQFRFRLVWLFEKLFSILENDPDFTCFNFDGQTIVLEDFLELKPYERERLKKYISEGRIFVGPWYVLPDEFLVSGESLVRNLQIGTGLAEEFGSDWKIGYLPDMFGHISQMPQIMNNFGINNAFLWRGVSGTAEDLKSEFIWRGPDGSELLTAHFHDRHGYANGKNFGDELERSIEELTSLTEEMAPFATTENLLIMNGVDHMDPKENLTTIVKEINDIAGREMVKISSLQDYAEVLKNNTKDLKVISGELRAVDRVSGTRYYDFILSHVLSARMYLKQSNFKVQTLLEKWSEPFASLAWVQGGDYPGEFLNLAWKTLIKNHPHDDICGCSTDEVHKNNETWFMWAEQTAQQVLDNSLQSLTSNIRTPALDENEVAVSVFNALTWNRSETIELQADFPLDLPIKAVSVKDSSGNELSTLITKIENAFVVPNIKGLYPPDGMKNVQRVTIRTFVNDIPSMGYRIFKVKALPMPTRQSSSLVTGSRSMENDYLKVEINSDGTLDVLHKEINRLYKGLHYFSNSGDAGNEYVYSRPLFDSLILSTGSSTQISLVENSNVCATFEIKSILMVPESLTADKKSRSEKQMELPIISKITLKKESSRLDITSKVSNHVEDHRLRVMIPTWIDSDHSWSDSQFDMIQRPVHVEQPTYDEWTEDAPVTYPMQNFADFSDAEGGIALATHGLPEYEVTDNKERAIALTLLRCVGKLGTGDGNLAISCATGPDVDTPGGQCPGEFDFSYSLIFHKGSWKEGNVYHKAMSHNVPLRQYQVENNMGELSESESFFRIESELLQFSSLKRAADGSSLAMRLFNPCDQDISADIHFDLLKVTKAFKSDFTEISGEELSLKNNVLKIDAGPKEIVTIILTPDRGDNIELR